MTCGFLSRRWKVSIGISPRTGSSEADLIAQLLHQSPPTSALLIGRAFDAIVCDPRKYAVPGGCSSGRLRVW